MGDKYFKYFTVYLFLLLTSQVTANENHHDVNMDIFSREAVPEHQIIISPALSKAERKWLNSKKTLILAVPIPDSPPIDITQRAAVYEGATADILGIVSSTIGVNVVVRTFSSRDDAIKALNNREVDLLSGATGYEKQRGMILTRPYIYDEPAIYKGISISSDKVKTIAMADGYLSLADAINYLPKMRIKIYPSTYSAVAAAVYGECDAVLTDMLSGNFLLNKLYHDSLQLVRPLYADTSGFAFALREDNVMLHEIMNKALNVISDQHRDVIVKRWSGGGLSIQSRLPKLTPVQWQKINNKHIFNIAINKNLPPLSFVDINGSVHGIAADLFQVISSKLGITLNIVPTSSTDELMSFLDEGRVDLALLSPSNDRRVKYTFSQAFTLDPLVYVIKANKKGTDLLNLYKFGHSAVVKGTISSSIAENNISANNKIYFNTISDGIACVHENKCDVIVLPLRVAKFFINEYYPETLIVAGELQNSVPIGAAFASKLDNQWLIDVINNILFSIPPDELEGLATRWRVSAKQEVITWHDVFKEFGLFISLGSFLFFYGLMWLLSLRKQVLQRKKAEIALKSQLKFIEELVDSMPHPIYAVDANGIIVLCNRAYASFFNRHRDDILGLSLRELRELWPFIYPITEKFNDLLAHAIPHEGDIFISKDEGDISILHWLQEYRDLSGYTKGGVGGWIDVSDRVSLLQELSQATNIAQTANRAKSTFLATMSHEIRTPMNAIIGLLELTLRRERLHEEDKASLSIAHDSAKDLLSLIGDILDFSKIESGRFEIKPEPHDVVGLTESVVTVFNSLARQKNITLDLVADAPLWVQIDGICYKQIISNLISNAIKYTEKGGVRVEINSKSSDGWCTLNLMISDSGIGIDLVEQANLFQPFCQASQPEHIQRSGTGLGLMISRTLCESMGGSLNLESELGCGTRVYIEMKLPVAAEVDKVTSVTLSATVEHVRPLRVMVVDDHPANRMLVSQQLAYLGHDAISVDSGIEALSLFTNFSFDAIITDFNMPGMSGFELTRQWRALEQKSGAHRCLILGLTADARQEQVDESLVAGMDDCLFKPVGLEALEHSLCRCDVMHGDQREIESCAQEIKQCLASLTGNQHAVMKSLLKEFICASDDDLLSLQQAVDANDLRRFFDYVHRMKGGARIMGALQFIKVCRDIESTKLEPQGLHVSLIKIQHAYGIVRRAIVKMESEMC